MPDHDSLENLEELQLGKLKALLKEISTGNDFYRHKLNGAGFDLQELEGFQDLKELLERLPFTSKEELQEDQAEHPPYGSNLTFEPGRYTRVHRTSGTTGKPVYWLDTPESWQWFIDCWKKVYTGSGILQEDRIFFPFSFGPFIGFWGAFEAGLQLGSFCLSGGGLSSAARLEYLLENKITVVCCTPSYALHLGEIARQEGVDLASSPVRALLVAGEPGGQINGTREKIQDTWGARVFDHHGMTEIGCVTFEHPDYPGALYPLEEDFIVEVLEHGKSIPAPDGVPGELVLTNLGRTASPLLRYRTGDIVCREPIDREKAGGAFQASGVFKGGILGRADDMFFVKGNNVYPTTVESIIREFPEVAEYRMRVVESGGLNSLEVDIEADSELINQVDPAGEPLEKRIEEALHDALLFRVRVFPVGRGGLPRFELKASRLVREKDKE